MMKIDVRRLDNKYREVKVETDNATIDLGVFDEDECRTLAMHFEEASDELVYGWDD